MLLDVSFDADACQEHEQRQKRLLEAHCASSFCFGEQEVKQQAQEKREKETKTEGKKEARHSRQKQERNVDRQKETIAERKKD